MSGLAYDAPESESGPSSASESSADFYSVPEDVHANWTPGNRPHDAGGPVDDFYSPPRMSPQLPLDMLLTHLLQKPPSCVIPITPSLLYLPEDPQSMTPIPTM